ncbi:MAG: 30S ribosome-binding factor RbfA [Myxococcales bacterium]|nr:MAG: 30S ribosome-binding factor RbfA [Myxococcales bacterium]
MKERAKSHRAERVAERVREELMAILLSGALHGTSLSEVTVATVRMTPDLRVAHIYVGPGLQGNSQEEEQRLLDELKRKGSWLRKRLAGRLGLRYVPELRFVWDSEAERINRVEHLLNDVHSTTEDG